MKTIWGCAALLLLTLAILLILTRPVTLQSGPQLEKARQYFTETEILAGKAYNQKNLQFFFAAKMLTLIFLVGVLGCRPFRDLWRHGKGVYLTAMILTYWLVLLPLAYWRGYLVEHQFGLSQETFVMWFKNLLKAKLFYFFVYLALGQVFFTVYARWKRFWGVSVATTLWLIMVLWVGLSPPFINPLFYRFTPLENGALKEKISELSQATQIPVDNMEVMAASQRTKKMNAYVNGLGKTKQIVLYDTLLQHADDDEILTVVAHEMGHWHHRHLLKGLALALPALLIFFGLCSFILEKCLPHFPTHPTTPLIIFLLLVTTLGQGLRPIACAVSRHFERQADQFSLTYVPLAPAFIRKQVELARRNRSDVLPDAWVKLFFATHPTTLERIAMAENN